MNKTILQKYGLEMRKTPEKFNGYIAGSPIASYISMYRHPDDIDDLVAEIDLAMNGHFNQIEDPDHGGGIGSYWFAQITPLNFELWQEGYPKLMIPLQEWKEILLSWKKCLE